MLAIRRCACALPLLHIHSSSLQHLVLALFNVSDVALPIIEALTQETNTEQLLPSTWSISFEAENLHRDMNLLTGMNTIKCS